MSGRTDVDLITELLRQLPKASIPADLVASIEAETLFRTPWWQSESFRLRWAPVLVGVATALGALWLCRIQAQPGPRTAIPMAARPALQAQILHAFVPPNESSQLEKGESRENPKS